MFFVVLSLGRNKESSLKSSNQRLSKAAAAASKQTFSLFILHQISVARSSFGDLVVVRELSSLHLIALCVIEGDLGVSSKVSVLEVVIPERLGGTKVGLAREIKRATGAEAAHVDGSFKGRKVG